MGEDDSPLVGDVDLFVTVGLLLFCLVSHLKSRVYLPASGPLIMLGVVLRLVGRLVENSSGTMNFSYDIEKEIIELVFLPTLITECALSIDWHIFRQQIMQILTLAVPAVIVSSLLTAVLVKEVIGYNAEFRWYSALMIGAVFSATDHVSVVAILKEMKADERLMTLMQGETLVNDGTVFVLFTFALRGATGQSESAGEMTALVFQQSLGGIALAIVFCAGASVWLYFVVNDAVVESLLTLCSSYLLFYTSTLDAINVSGALGTVVFGLYMSAYGKLFISPKSEKSFHFIWKTLGSTLEALLLLMCGALVGSFILDKGHLEASDIGKLFPFFALQYVVRAITILVHWPLIWYFDLKIDGKRFSLRAFDYRKVLVLIFGGLKGTMSISLTLILHQHADFSELQHDLMLYWAVGITALSNTVGALVLFGLVKCLGLEQMSFYDQNILLSFQEKLRNDTSQRYEEVTHELGFISASVTHVREKLLDDEFYCHLKQFTNLKYETDTFEDAQSSLHVPLGEQDRVFYLRKLYFRMLKGMYIELFDRHVCYRDSCFLLIESVYRGIHLRLRRLDDWDFLERQLQPPRLMSALRVLSRIPLFGRFFRRLRFYFLYCAYDVTKNFIQAHEEANAHLWPVLDKNLFTESVREQFREETDTQVQKAKVYLQRETHSSEFREVIAYVQTNQLRLLMLNFQIDRLQKLFTMGVIGSLQHRVAERWLAHELQREERRLLFTEHAEEYFLRHSFLFERCSEHLFRELVSGFEVFHVHKDNEVQPLHLQEGLLLLTKGRLLLNGSLPYEEGDFLGIETALISADYAIDWYVSSVVACVHCIYVYFSAEKTKEFMRQNDMLRRLCVLYAEHAVRTNSTQYGDLGKVKSVELRTIMQESVLQRHDQGEKLDLSSGMFLVCGELEDAPHAPAYIRRRKNIQSRVVTATLSLSFQEEMTELEEDISEAITEFRVNRKSLTKTALRTRRRKRAMELQVSITR